MGLVSSLRQWFEPTLDALLAPGLPFTYRWRLLALQPIATLSYFLKAVPWLLSNSFDVVWIPTRGGHDSLRALVFTPRDTGLNGRLRPLHLDIHGGVFIGGLAEYDAGFCERVCRETGAAVVSTQYRHSPRHVFPAAHEDIEDVSNWLLKNAEEKWGADPSLLTVSGFSAGSNLAFGVSQMAEGKFRWPNPTAVKGVVAFYAPVGQIRGNKMVSIISLHLPTRRCA
jgi:acetyl esterase/lipase